jgi:Tfp pilus assembly protein PilV
MSGVRRSGGFALIQVLFALMLLGAFALAATHVFRMSVLTTESSARGHERSLRVEQSLHTMRSDVWQADSVDTVEPMLLRLTGLDGVVEWKTQGEGELMRTTGKDVRKWTTLDLRFERQGSAVLVKDKDDVLAVLERGGAK